MMKTDPKIRHVLTMLLLVWLSACSSSRIDFTATPSERVMLTPYRTGIAEPLGTPTREASSVPIPMEPTPTPLVYTVVVNDTMLGIAFRYGISLDELLAANPDVDPQFLPVGIELIIPIHGVEAPLDASATPIPLIAQQPSCYSDGLRGSWCFLLISNDQDFSVENITATIDIYTADGEQLVTADMIALVNALPPDESMPLVYSSNQDLPRDAVTVARVLSAIPITEDSDRYLLAELTQAEIRIDESGNQAHVNGLFRVLSESKTATIIWILAVAYDENGNVVGVRRFEHSGEVPGGTNIDFSFWVYSLGPPIQRVDTLIEARP